MQGVQGSLAACVSLANTPAGHLSAWPACSCLHLAQTLPVKTNSILQYMQHSQKPTVRHMRVPCHVSLHGAVFCVPRRPDTPTMLDYKIHTENDSMYNTPPCWAIYVCGLVFEHLLKKGASRLWAHKVLLTNGQHTKAATQR